MSNPTKLTEQSSDTPATMTKMFDRRRRKLGMTFEVLATRSTVPVSTLKNIFGKGLEHATFSNVLAIADALGINIDATPRIDVYNFREEQAKRKAKELVEQVQSTMALEAQGWIPQIQKRWSKNWFTD